MDAIQAMSSKLNTKAMTFDAKIKQHDAKQLIKQAAFRAMMNNRTAANIQAYLIAHRAAAASLGVVFDHSTK